MPDVWNFFPYSLLILFCTVYIIFTNIAFTMFLRILNLHCTVDYLFIQ